MIREQSSCPRRRWGKTGLSIPVIPFGTQGFGDHFGPVGDEEAVGLIRRAVDLGVNHFDCARCYGNSLRKLGLAVKQGAIDREERVHGNPIGNLNIEQLEVNVEAVLQPLPGEV